MPLADLLQAIQADADEEAARLARTAATEADLLVEQAQVAARALQVELAAAPEAAARRSAERATALARLAAAAAVRQEREDGFAVVLDGVRTELAAQRDSDSYPKLMRELVAESRAALPEASVLCIDPRDADLARLLAGELRVEAVLTTWGGVELVSDDGRRVRNTLEERLANAKPALRLRFAHRIAQGAAPLVRSTR